MTIVAELKNDIDVQAKIKKELQRLNKIFEDIESNRKGTVKSLIENASFMSVMLDELQQHIAVHGTTSEYQNGANQWGTKRSPEVEVYNSMIKNHITIIKQLTDALNESGVDVNDGFDEFINRRDA